MQHEFSAHALCILKKKSFDLRVNFYRNKNQLFFFFWTSSFDHRSQCTLWHERRREKKNESFSSFFSPSPFHEWFFNFLLSEDVYDWHVTNSLFLYYPRFFLTHGKFWSFECDDEIKNATRKRGIGFVAWWVEAILSALPWGNVICI